MACKVLFVQRIGELGALLKSEERPGDVRLIRPPPDVARCRQDTSPNQDNFSITHFKSGYTLICTFDGHGPFGPGLNQALKPMVEIWREVCVCVLFFSF